MPRSSHWKYMHILKKVKWTRIRLKIFFLSTWHSRQLYHVFNTVLTEILSPVYSISTRERKDLSLHSMSKNGLFKIMFYNGAYYARFNYSDSLFPQWLPARWALEQVCGTPKLLRVTHDRLPGRTTLVRPKNKKKKNEKL